MNQSAVFYTLAIVIGGGVSFVLTPLVGALARRCGLFLDIPDSRRVHAQPIPRCGGIAIFTAFHLASFTLLALPGFHLLHGAIGVAWSTNFLLASTFLLLVGLWDDLRGLSWLTKLIAQVLTAIFLSSQGIEIQTLLGFELPGIARQILTIAWFVIIINGFNLIDGLDGLATGLAVCGALGLAAMAFYSRNPADAVFLVAFIGACLAFLRYNFHPARIFLGDSGSMFLGLTLATVALSMQNKATVVCSLTVPLLAVGVPLFDTLLAIWRRSVRMLLRKMPGHEGGAGVVSADLDHLHHRLYNAGFSQRKVALWLYAAALALVIVGTLSLQFSSQQAGILIIAFVAGMYVVVRHVAHTELWDSGTLLVEGWKRPTPRVVAALLYPISDFLVLNLALAGSIMLRVPALSLDLFKEHFFAGLPLWCALPYLALIAGGTYRKVWSRARMAEFALLALTTITVSALCFGICALRGSASLRENFLQAILFANLALWGLLGSRALPTTVKDLMAYVHIRAARHAIRKTREVVYGAGARCQFYLAARLARGESAELTPQLVGLIDDDRNLRGRSVFGCAVLGNGRELRRLISSRRIERVVVACNLSASKLRVLREIGEKCGIEIRIWEPVEHRLLHAKPQGSSADPSTVGNWTPTHGDEVSPSLNAENE